MTRRQLASRRERVRAAVAAIAVNLFLGAALVTGLALREEARQDGALETFDITLPSPPPPPPTIERPKPRPAEREPEGSSGREASPVLATPSPVPRPTPVVAAPNPASGLAATSGRGTSGSGPGSGGAGSGAGGGGLGSQPVARAQLLSGMIGDRDNRGGRHVGRVVVELGIASSGQVSACRLVESSGNPATDDLTCRLSYRILFRPARLASGQPVPDHTFYVVNWRGR